MQINDRFNNSPIPPNRRGDDSHASVQRGETSEAPTALRTSIAGSVLHELRGLPELRPDLIARVRQRLESGDYLTHDAARATASAMLNAG
jgi:hypothetical protein